MIGFRKEKGVITCVLPSWVPEEKTKEVIHCAGTRLLPSELPLLHPACEDFTCQVNIGGHGLQISEKWDEKHGLPSPAGEHLDWWNHLTKKDAGMATERTLLIKDPLGTMMLQHLVSQKLTSHIPTKALDITMYHPDAEMLVMMYPHINGGTPPAGEKGVAKISLGRETHTFDRACFKKNTGFVKTILATSSNNLTKALISAKQEDIQKLVIACSERKKDGSIALNRLRCLTRITMLQHNHPQFNHKVEQIMEETLNPRLMMDMWRGSYETVFQHPMILRIIHRDGIQPENKDHIHSLIRRETVKLRPRSVTTEALKTPEGRDTLQKILEYGTSLGPLSFDDTSLENLVMFFPTDSLPLLLFDMAIPFVEKNIQSFVTKELKNCRYERTTPIEKILTDTNHPLFRHVFQHGTETGKELTSNLIATKV